MARGKASQLSHSRLQNSRTFLLFFWENGNSWDPCVWTLEKSRTLQEKRIKAGNWLQALLLFDFAFKSARSLHERPSKQTSTDHVSAVTICVLTGWNFLCCSGYVWLIRLQIGFQINQEFVNEIKTSFGCPRDIQYTSQTPLLWLYNCFIRISRFALCPYQNSYTAKSLWTPNRHAHMRFFPSLLPWC